MALKYGQMLIATKETTAVIPSTGETINLPKGTLVVVGFDRVLHFLNSDYVQPLTDGYVVDGYSNTGVVATIWQHLCTQLPMTEMLEATGTEPKKVKDAIADALEEIGLYDYDAEDDE